MRYFYILLFAILAALPVFSQNYEQIGDSCFKQYNYSCAIDNYNKAHNAANDKNKRFVKIKLNRANSCKEYIETANQEFLNKNYKRAEEYYDSVCFSNTVDLFAQQRRDSCIDFLMPDSERLKISGIMFKNGNGVTISDYGDELYTNLHYLFPKITFTSSTIIGKKVTLYIKIISPKGALLSGQGSPTNYSYSLDFDIPPKKDTITTAELYGWGSDEVTHFYTPGKYQFEIWNSGAKIFSSSFQVKRELTDDEYFTINNAEFKALNASGQLLSDYGQPIYVDASYVCPRITCTNLVGKSKKITVGIKIFTPKGQLMTTIVSKAGYSFYSSLQLGNSSTEQQFILQKWGNDDGTFYKESGRYQFEVWCNTKKTFSSYFDVHGKSNSEIDPYANVDTIGYLHSGTWFPTSFFPRLRFRNIVGFNFDGVIKCKNEYGISCALIKEEFHKKIGYSYGTVLKNRGKAWGIFNSIVMCGGGAYYGLSTSIVNTAYRTRGINIALVQKNEYQSGFSLGLFNNVSMSGKQGGFQFGLYNQAGKQGGFQLGLVNNTRDVQYFLQSGLCNIVKYEQYGFQLGLYNQAGDQGGFQISLVNNTRGDQYFLQSGICNIARDYQRGLQLGGFNRSRNQAGLQFGAINNINGRRGEQSGIQLGFANWVNGYRSEQKGIQLSLLNYTEAYQLFLQTGIFNINGGKQYGIQLGGFNYVNDKQGGLQASILNINGGDQSGVQLGGLNYVNSEQNGIQASFVNLVGDDQQGFQAGIINYVKGTQHGLQAGFFNFACDEQHGVQLGVLNYNDMQYGIQLGTLNISGASVVQVGLINFTNELRGFQLGLLNFAMNTGIKCFPIVMFY